MIVAPFIRLRIHITFICIQLNSLNMPEVSAGVVFCDGNLLCMQRNYSKFNYISYKFEFPGGKVELGEDPQTALIREFKEELDANISTSNIHELGTFTHKYPDFSITLHVFIIFVNNFTFTRKEHIDQKWLKIDDLQSLDWAEADRKILPDLISYLKKSIN